MIYHDLSLLDNRKMLVWKSRRMMAYLTLGILFFTHHTSTVSSPSHIPSREELHQISSQTTRWSFFSWKWSHLRSFEMHDSHLLSEGMISNNLPESNGKYGRLCTRAEWVGWRVGAKMSLVPATLSCQRSSTKPLRGLSYFTVFHTQVAMYFGAIFNSPPYAIHWWNPWFFDRWIASLANPPSKRLKLLAAASLHSSKILGETVGALAASGAGKKLELLLINLGFTLTWVKDACIRIRVFVCVCACVGITEYTCNVDLCLCICT